MERADLLEANGAIFKPQGKAINASAASDIKVLVVGNPANTNALIAHEPRAGCAERALHGDDPPGPEPRIRATRQEARRRGLTDIENLSIWGNHTPTMFPDLFNAKVKGQNAVEAVDDMAWYENEYLPTVGKRGAAIIEARGASSAASAASAAIDHVHDWVLGTPSGDWVSMAVPSDGQYGVAEGIISSLPGHAAPVASTTIVEGHEVGEFAQAKMDATVAELVGERNAVQELGLV